MHLWVGAAGDGSDTWVPGIYMRNVDWILYSWFVFGLVLVFTSVWDNEPMDQRSVLFASEISKKKMQKKKCLRHLEHVV